MGNCQAADAATVVIVRPSGYKYNKVDMINYTSSLTAGDVMDSYPGHYVAQLLLPINNNSSTVNKRKQLKLLQPHHTLLIGQVYHLITYQDVLKEFGANKCMKLGKLLMDRGLIQEVDVTNNNKKHTPGAPVHVSSVKAPRFRPLQGCSPGPAAQPQPSTSVASAPCSVRSIHVCSDLGPWSPMQMLLAQRLKHAEGTYKHGLTNIIFIFVQFIAKVNSIKWEQKKSTWGKETAASK